MAKLEFFAVSESISVDQSTNKVSLFEILESIPIDPASSVTVIPKCVAASLWRMEAGDENRDFQIMLRLYQPGEEVSEDFATNLTATSARHRVFTTLIGVPLRGPGDLRFEILLNGVHAAEHVVTLEKEESDEELPS